VAYILYSAGEASAAASRFAFLYIICWCFVPNSYIFTVFAAYNCGGGGGDDDDDDDDDDDATIYV
jgi:hypothetical protein